MVEISYETYEQWLEAFDKMPEPDYFPTPNDFEIMEENPEFWVLFLCYLDACLPKAKEKDEKYSKKNIQLFLKEHLKITED